MADRTAVNPQETLVRIERRIRELERVRAAKPAGSWLYAIDTEQIERLRAERDRCLAGISVFEQCA